MYRVTERSLGRFHRDRANLCPDIVQQQQSESENLSNSNWHYTTAHKCFYPVPHYLKSDQQSQTEILKPLQVIDTGAQYSSPSESSDNSTSDSDSEIEGTENITVAKQYVRRSLSSEDLYTAPTPPNKWFRMSTLDPTDRKLEKEPLRCPLKEIVNHRGALNVPPVDIIVAPGRQAANTQQGLQRVQAMAGRGGGRKCQSSQSGFTRH